MLGALTGMQSQADDVIWDFLGSCWPQNWKEEGNVCHISLVVPTLPSSAARCERKFQWVAVCLIPRGEALPRPRLKRDGLVENDPPKKHNNRVSHPAHRQRQSKKSSTLRPFFVGCYCFLVRFLGASLRRLSFLFWHGAWLWPFACGWWWMGSHVGNLSPHLQPAPLYLIRMSV